MNIKADFQHHLVRHSLFQIVFMLQNRSYTCSLKTLENAINALLV